MSETAILHGIEISPFVTERTIGPDLPKWQDNVGTEAEEAQPEKQNYTDEMSKTIANLSLNENKCSPPKKAEHSPSSISNIDLESIKMSAVFREASNKQKTKVRELLIDVIKKRPLVEQQSSTLSFKEWLINKKASDNKLLEQAEAETDRQLEEYRRQLSTLQEHTQSMVAQLKKKAAEAKKAHEESLIQQQKLQLQRQQQQQRELEEAEEQKKQLQQQQQQLEQQRIEQESRNAAAEASAMPQQEQQNTQPPEYQNNEQQQFQTNVATPQQQTTTNTAETQQQQQQQEAQQKTNVVGDIASPERLSFLANVNAVFLQKLESARNLQVDDGAKNLKNIYKKAINAPINAICAVSGENLNDKYIRILSFFNGQPVSNSDITINSHPVGRDYCIMLMAKKFVSQADSAISSNPQSAYPIASVVVALWQQMPDFGATLLAHLYEESPFLLPRFITPKQGQDTVDYLKLIGYRLVEGGTLEAHEDFLKRQTGMARLYAALMVTHGRKADAAQHPFGLQEAWRWLANFVRLDPLPDISATILLEILQIVSVDMWTIYGKQFTKIILHIQQHYMRKLDVVDKGGPKTRLQLLLNNFLNKGQVTRPIGMLPPNFW